VPIVWARRRDQHIVKYLLLQPDGAATRTHLAEVFCPATARPQAMQNLRTACSTIRRAIGNVVGLPNVDAYFVAGDRLAFNRAAIVCDVERFRHHAACAEADDAADGAHDAVAHLRAAERLYGHGLFAGDVSEPLFLAEAQDLAALYARVLGRLSGMLIERGSLDLARGYAAKAHKLGLLPDAERGPQVHLRVAAS
jgi:DNA-binding SARP family transcriptional activator